MVQNYLLSENTSPTLNKHQLIPTGQRALDVYTAAEAKQEEKMGFLIFSSTSSSKSTAAYFSKLLLCEYA